MTVWDDGTGPALYAAGYFAGSGTATLNDVARWNGSTWSSLGSGLNGFVRALAVFDDGTGGGEALYAGGEFTTAGGVPVRNLARWDGAHWSAVSTGTEAAVRAPAAFHDAAGARSLFVGGDFTGLGGVPAVHVGAVNACDEVGDRSCFGDGSGAACPCGNSSAVGADAGCLNSLGAGGSLRAHGAPSLASDTLTLQASDLTNGAVIFFQGTAQQNGGAGSAFGDGLRCASGTLVRLGAKTPGGGTARFPGPGDASTSTRGLVFSPGTRTYQARYRNAASFCTSASFNFTNGVRVVWVP